MRAVVLAALLFFVLFAGAANAACPAAVPGVSRPPSDGSVFATGNRDVTLMETQTSDAVRITGGCIDAAVLGAPLTNAGLKLVRGAAGTRVVRAGFTTAGDGGGGVPYDWSASNCSAADNGAQVQPTGIIGCWIADFAGLRPTPKMWGAKGDGVTDDTTTIQAAATALGSNPLHLSAGTYKVTDLITFGISQTVHGDGRTKSVISVPATFNLSALGVLRLGAAETGASLYDVGVEFTQPDATLKASMTQYPPAIYAVGAARFVVDRVRISGAWDGIKATGNAGGAFIGDVEIGAINKNIELGGALDFVHGGHWHIWPLGFQTVNRLAAWAAAVPTAVEFGDVDALEIGAITSFQAKITVTAASGILPAQIGRVALDGNGAGLSVVNNTVMIGSLYTTKDTGSVSPSISVGAGGTVTIGAFDQNVTSASDDVVVNNATGHLLINGGTSLQNALGFSAFHVSAGVLALNNMRIKHPSSGARTVASVRQTSTGVLRMSGNQWSAKGSASGSALTIAAEQILHSIVNNDFVDWDVTFPSVIGNGEYGPNNITVRTATPTVGFATNGDFVPTYTTQTTQYQFMGAGTVWFQTLVLFNTNAFTTPSGAFQINIGTPAAPVVDMSVTLGDMANVTYNSAILSGALIGTDNKILLRQFVSDAAMSNMGTTNVLASKTGVLFRMTGTFRYK